MLQSKSNTSMQNTFSWRQKYCGACVGDGFGEVENTIKLSWKISFTSVTMFSCLTMAFLKVRIHSIILISFI